MRRILYNFKWYINNFFFFWNLFRYLHRRCCWWCFCCCCCCGDICFDGIDGDPYQKFGPLNNAPSRGVLYCCTAIKFRPFRRTLQGDLVIVSVYCRRVKARRHILCTRNGTIKCKGVSLFLKKKKTPQHSGCN